MLVLNTVYVCNQARIARPAVKLRKLVQQQVSHSVVLCLPRVVLLPDRHLLRSIALTAHVQADQQKLGLQSDMSTN